jgi:hypothetical protein
MRLNCLDATIGNSPESSAIGSPSHSVEHVEAPTVETPPVTPEEQQKQVCDQRKHQVCVAQSRRIIDGVRVC